MKNRLGSEHARRIGIERADTREQHEVVKIGKRPLADVCRNEKANLVCKGEAC